MTEDPVKQLVDVMERLRAENGCPWDREQTHETLKPYVIEEAYELLDAIDDCDDDLVIDELGDVLLQVVFHCQIAREEGRYDLDEVARRLSEKLIRRHPHVFATAQVDSAEGVVRQWEEIKKGEKASSKRDSVLDGVPRHIPSLSCAQKLQRKAAKVGFDWPDAKGVLEKIEEEVGEFREALGNNDSAAIEEEIGDILFSIVNLSRFLSVDSEEALRQANKKFYRRFLQVESLVAAAGRELKDCTLEELDLYWDQVKLGEK